MDAMTHAESSLSPPFDLSIKLDLRPGERGGDARRRYEEALEEIRFAEILGFRAVGTGEQHAVADGSLGAQLPFLAGVATVTSQVRLMTSCLLLPLYKWRQVVEEATVVDLLSGGRLELGVAAGVYDREFQVFSVNARERGRLMEQGVQFIREGLIHGELPDGPGGTMFPISPRPAQARIPILFGGLSAAAVDRAVRLGDGHIAYDWERPEMNLPRHWEETLLPALKRHRRSLEDFRFIVAAGLWIGDDPEREWELVFGPAFTYQQKQYVRMAGDQTIPDGVARLINRDHLFVDTPEATATRLLQTWRRAPWDELMFYYRLPRITHETAMSHLERVAHRLAPLLASMNAASQ